MTKKIDDFMTLAEAADRWGISYSTLRNKLKPSVVGQEKINNWIELGLIKFWQSPGKSQKTWIITKEIMTEWYGEEPKNIKKD